MNVHNRILRPGIIGWCKWVDNCRQRCLLPSWLTAGFMNICLRTPNTTDIMLKTTGKICYQEIIFAAKIWSYRKTAALTQGFLLKILGQPDSLRRCMTCEITDTHGAFCLNCHQSEKYYMQNAAYHHYVNLFCPLCLHGSAVKITSWLEHKQPLLCVLILASKSPPDITTS